ncbi:MAG TPA: FAD-dependent oxidoreductase [Pyrinomonadaceae bacterium]|nr:FAD-dependent oxidoreductase [Pyrinomonadaceae bacterium]
MAYDVVVVGGGIGGLTAAALLSVRGVKVCLLERNAQVGGCVRRIEYSGLDFEPGMGLYTGFGPGEIFDRIFSQLPVSLPEAQLVDSDYVVRLSDQTDVRLRKNHSQFAEELRRGFPECASEAVRFYETVARLPSEFSNDVVLDHASSTSPRFQRFIDAQLRAFIQTPIERCAFLSGCRALTLSRGNLYEITGGIATVAESLAEAIAKVGGKVRLNSPVLRLAYDESGAAIGVDLLNGERVLATRAVISNMTIWDTYGKLIGLNRTPNEIKKKMAGLTSTGVYLIYASLEEDSLRRLPGKRFLVCGDSVGESLESSDLSFATSAVVRDGKIPVTVKVNCPVYEWFTFQSSPDDFETWDQEALERVWTKLHQAVPEFWDSIEIIETANPRTFYDDTRRKLGMVLGVEQTAETLQDMVCETSLPNVFAVGDTVSNPNLASVVSNSARLVKRLP